MLINLGFYLYLLFTASWFLNLGVRVSLLGALHFDLLVVGVLFLIIIFGTLSKTLIFVKNRTNSILIYLLVYIVLTLPLVEWPGSVLKQNLEIFIKAIVFYYFTILFITDERKMKIFLTLFLVVQTFRIIEPLYLHLTDGYWGSAAFAGGEFMDRLAGAPSDTVNPNGLAFIIVSVTPLFFYLFKNFKGGSILFLLVLPFFVYTLMLTGSRSGFVGMGIILFIMFLKSRRKLLFMLIGIVGLFIFWSNLDPMQKDRYLSIVDSNTANASTAEGRWEGVIRDFEVGLRRPFFGYGLGTSKEANANYGGVVQVSHNLYTEVFQELGIFGLFIFLAFIWSVIKDLLNIYKINITEFLSSQNYLLLLREGLLVWLIMNVIMSFFSYGLSSYYWYLFAGLAVALSNVIIVELTEMEKLDQEYLKRHAEEFVEIKNF